jgi:hypothetical protein
VLLKTVCEQDTLPEEDVAGRSFGWIREVWDQNRGYGRASHRRKRDIYRKEDQTMPKNEVEAVGLSV